MDALMNALKVVVTDHDFDDFSAEQEVFSQRGIAMEAANCKTESQIIEVARKADGLLVQAAPITAAVLAKLENCRAIARYGVGVDTIDIEAATRLGIVVANVRDYCFQEVADQAMTLLLAQARRVVIMNEQVKGGTWDVYKDGRPIRRLADLVLGIIGFGSIGRALAARARAFGLKVLAFDPWLEPEVVSSQGGTPVGLQQLLQESDFVSLHAPLVPQTRHIIDTPQLNLMKPTAFLINTSRGGLIREEALVKALGEGRIAGAALDVLEKEPPDPSNPLLKMKNVVLTPHAAFYSQESSRAMHTKAALAVALVLAGEIPESVVNPEVLDQIPLQKR